MEEGDASMNYRKASLGVSIALGVIVGGFLAVVSDGLILGGILLGGLLGGLVYAVIDWAVSRRRTRVVPYDRLDEYHQVNTPVSTQTPEARLREIQDGHIDQYMPFQHPKR
jgi:hypothetical protein